MKMNPVLSRTPQMLLGCVMILAIGILQLSACAADGQPSVLGPKDFAQTELFTMAIATEVLSQADILVVAGVIRPDDARSLVRQTDQVKADVQLAKTINLTQPGAGLERINLALQTIQSVRNYLVTKGATFTSAATG